MRTHLFLLLILAFHMAKSQSVCFKENNKWGIKENEKIIIPAVYDSVFNFDKQMKVCLACFKNKSTNTNKFIKVTSNKMYCNYLNHESKRLILRTALRDTFSVFLFGKNTVQQYNENDTLFKVSYKNNKYLVKKDFTQLTFKEYYDIDLCDDPNYYVTQVMSEADVPLFGMVSTKEEQIIPNEFSGIKLNPVDSLVMVCEAGVRNSSEDYVYNYEGKRLRSFKHHIDLATKEFIVFKVFEPKEHFVIYKVSTAEENDLEADEVRFYNKSCILIRLKNTWWVYNPSSREKSELKK